QPGVRAAVRLESAHGDVDVPVGDDEHVVPASRELGRERTADPARRARDERDAAVLGRAGHGPHGRSGASPSLSAVSAGGSRSAWARCPPRNALAPASPYAARDTAIPERRRPPRRSSHDAPYRTETPEFSAACTAPTRRARRSTSR